MKPEVKKRKPNSFFISNYPTPFSMSTRSGKVYKPVPCFFVKEEPASQEPVLFNIAKNFVESNPEYGNAYEIGYLLLDYPEKFIAFTNKIQPLQERLAFMNPVANHHESLENGAEKEKLAFILTQLLDQFSEDISKLGQTDEDFNEI